MSEMQVITNNQWRDTTYIWDVPADVMLSDFDWMFLASWEMSLPREDKLQLFRERIKSDDFGYIDGFFRYRGTWHHLTNFERRDGIPPWDGIQCNTYFSGVVIRVSDDGERVICGRVYA
jgi:hypothetical protein